MCRFAGYIGNEYMVLSEIFDKNNHSLIKQSLQAKETIHTINGDGCGIAWYNHNVDDDPAVYKSENPAWNDYNLMNILSKVRSKCFIGHIRASTVGEVILSNCHPFSHREFSLVHNGTINGFDKIRKSVLNELDADHLNIVKGTTDSEHLFAMIMQQLCKIPIQKITPEHMIAAMGNSIKTIINLQKEVANDLPAYVNLLLTNGTTLVACRYSNNVNDAQTLYYSTCDGGVTVASEPLDPSLVWREVAINHVLHVTADKQLMPVIDEFKI